MITRGSFKRFEICGTAVPVHPTFFLLVTWFGTVYWLKGGSQAAYLRRVLRGLGALQPSPAGLPIRTMQAFLASIQNRLAAACPNGVEKFNTRCHHHLVHQLLLPEYLPVNWPTLWWFAHCYSPFSTG